MKTRTISVLAILLVVLSVVYYFDYRSRVQRLGERTAQERLVDLPVAEIDRIGFRSPRGEVRLQKRGDQWWMTAPVEALANSERITEMILPQLDSARRYGAFAAPDSDLTRFGLGGTAGIEVAVGNSESRKSDRFVLGAPTPLEGECYVMDEPGTIHVTAAALRDALNKPVVDFLQPGVPGFDATQVKAIEVERLGSRSENSDQRFAFTQSDTGSWVLRDRAPGAPAGMVCDSEMIGQLMEGLSALRAVDLLTTAPETAASYGLEDPVGRLVAGEDGNRRVFLLGEPIVPPGKDLKLKPGEAIPASAFEQFAITENGRLIFSVGKTLATAIERPPHAYRDRRLMTIAPDDVCYLQVETQMGAHVQATALIREPGGEWRLTEDPAAAVNQGRVALYLKFCASLRVETWAPPIPTSGTAILGFDEPMLRVSVRTQDPASRQGFEIALPYDPPKSLFYGRHTGTLATSAEPDVFGVQLPESYVLMLRRTARYFRERRIFEVDMQSVQHVQVDISSARGATSVTLERKNDGLWQGQIAGREARSIPQNVTDPFFAVLRDLEYQVAIEAQTVTEQMRRLTGMDKPAVRFRMFDAGGQLIASLAIGMPGSESEVYLSQDNRGRYLYVHANTLKNVSSALQSVVARLQ